MRVCAETGCPILVPTGTRDGRCDEHRREKDRARGTRQERGYDAHHDRLRAHWQQRLDAGEQITCWRCKALGRPHDVEARAWRLGHCDTNRDVYHGPECIPGNQATSGRTRCPHPDHLDISPGA